MIKFVFWALVAVAVFAGSAVADVPATAYYVLKTEDLKNLLSAGKTIDELSVEALTDLEVAQGYFEGDCSIYLKTKQFQFRIRVSEDSMITGGKKVFSHPDKGTHRYALSMYSQEKKEPIIQCSGHVDLGESLSADKDWQKGEYTILFQKVNLKK